MNSQFELYLVLAIVGGVAVFQITILLLYLQVRNLIKKYEKTTQNVFETYLRQEMQQHLLKYLQTVLPPPPQLKTELTTLMQTQTQQIMQVVQADMTAQTNQQLASMAEAITKTSTNWQNQVSSFVNQTFQSLEQTQQTQIDKVTQEIIQYKQLRVEQIDNQIAELIKQVFGQIVSESLSVSQHTKIIKEELLKAREYYER